jgi:hypothetical protein
MNESELTIEAFNERNKSRRNSESLKDILYGNLPNQKDTNEAMSKATEKVISSLADISVNTEVVTEEFVKNTVTRFNTLVGQDEANNTHLKDCETLSPTQMQSVLRDVREQKVAKKVNNLRNINLNNNEWRNLMHIAGTGDTIDIKNILLVWNAIRKTTWEIKINPRNPKGTHDTCDYLEHLDGIRSVCSNYINPGDGQCAVHKTMSKLCSEQKQNISLFPVIFAGFVIYIEPDYQNKYIGRSPKTFQISRKLMTEEFITTKGKL